MWLFHLQQRDILDFTAGEKKLTVLCLPGHGLPASPSLDRVFSGSINQVVSIKSFNVLQ